MERERVVQEVLVPYKRELDEIRADLEKELGRRPTVRQVRNEMQRRERRRSRGLPAKHEEGDEA